MSTLSDVLRVAGEQALTAGPAIPGAIGKATTITGLALQAAAAIADVGGDPVVEIKRILSSHDDVARVHEEWDAAIKAKFGEG